MDKQQFIKSIVNEVETAKTLITELRAQNKELLEENSKLKQEKSELLCELSKLEKSVNAVLNAFGESPAADRESTVLEQPDIEKGELDDASMLELSHAYESLAGLVDGAPAEDSSAGFEQGDGEARPEVSLDTNSDESTAADLQEREAGQGDADAMEELEKLHRELESKAKSSADDDIFESSHDLHQGPEKSGEANVADIDILDSELNDENTSFADFVSAAASIMPKTDEIAKDGRRAGKPSMKDEEARRRGVMDILKNNSNSQRSDASET